MKTNDFNQAITSTKLKENLEKQFGTSVNLGKYNREQLEDIRNKLRTRVHQQEGAAGINDLLTNETYQKDKAMLQLLNTRIKEMLGENIKKLRDKMIELSEAKKSKPDFLDMDKDGDKKEPMKKAIADKKASTKKGVAEGSHNWIGYDLQPHDGEYYSNSSEFLSQFEADQLGNQVTSADGMEIRGYIDGVNVMAWRFKSANKVGGWGIYDDSALSAEQGVAEGTAVGKLDNNGTLAFGHSAKPGQMLHTKSGPIGVLGKDGRIQSKHEHSDNINHSHPGDKVYVKEQGVAEGTEQHSRARTWAQITSLEKQAKAASSPIKKQHYMKMAADLRSSLPTSDDVAEGMDGYDLRPIDNGEYYSDLPKFLSQFEADQLGNQVTSADGMEIRGYINGVNVMAWRFKSAKKIGGWGIYDDSALSAEQGVAEGFPTVADAQKRSAEKPSKFDSKKISTGTVYQRKADKDAEDEPKAKKVKESFPTVADAKKRADAKTSKFDSKKTSTGTVYSRKADKAADDEDEPVKGKNKSTSEGKDEGKPGKNFAKIAKSAAKEYGSEKAGARVAGSVRQKLKKAGKLESLESFRTNVRMVNEGLGRFLAEDEEGKAKAITAAGDMVNDFTSWMQRVGQYQTKSMIELADAIKADFGVEQAEAFKSTVGPALSATLEVLTAQREAVSNAVASLASGEPAAEPMGQEPGMDQATPDEMNAAPEDEFSASDAGAGAGTTGREMRESAPQRRARKLAESHSIMTKLSK